MPPSAWAQGPASAPAAKSDLDRQYDEAFQEMLRQPANLDVHFRFASLASQTGDLEGTISALERMLSVERLRSASEFHPSPRSRADHAFPCLRGRWRKRRMGVFVFVSVDDLQ